MSHTFFTPPIIATPTQPQNPLPLQHYYDPYIFSVTEMVSTYQVKGGRWTVAKRGKGGKFIHYLYWTDMRKWIRQIFEDTMWDADLIVLIQNLIMDMVPVRSGKLLDTILNSMRIARWTWMSTYYYMHFWYDYPVDRPYFIINPRHTIPDKGYGEDYTPRHPIPNRHLIRKTKGGNALYYLNDPAVYSNPQYMILSQAADVLYSDFEELFNLIEVTVKI